MNSFMANLRFVFDPVLPVPLLLVVAGLFIALTLWSYYRINRSLSRGRSIALLICRVAGIAMLFVILLQPSRRVSLPPPKIDKVTLIAIDTSRSMKQSDVEQTSRLEAAKNALYQSGLLPGLGSSNAPGVRLFEFNSDATPISSALENLKAEGSSTRIHHSVSSILNSLSQSEEARALIVLTDGHDFELINPAQTGGLARSRHVPIYAVPFGKLGNVRDISVRIGTYQPYCYVKQKARISGILRLVGCEYEDLTVQLLRNDQVVQTKHVSAEDYSQATVDFEVTEPEVGQFEYEIRAVPLEHEIDTRNNSALTYLNVIDQQIQVLLLEGSPYWDTTFLQRSLLRNDKINLDAILQYSTNRAHTLRKKGGELKIPASPDDFNQYDIIIVGRSIDSVLDKPGVENLKTFVRDHGGTVIFSRGKAFDSQPNELEPVIWDETPQEKVHLQVSREGQGAAPFKILGDENGGSGSLPDLIAGRKIRDRKPLTAILAQAQARDNGETMPGFVQRRFGQGQVLSVGVDGLWRWAFNAKAEGVNTVFDRFWDQMLLWLMAGRDTIPNKQYSFRCGSANILLGEKIYFKLVARTLDSNLKSLPVTIFDGEKEVAKTALVRADNQLGYRFAAEYLPEKTGKYRAVVTLPDGTRQESKFIVTEENLEETEVATDLAYLKRLSESSGGRLLTPDELKNLTTELQTQQIETAPKTKIVTLWDRPWVFYLIGALLSLDWGLRRRWGLS